MHLRIQLPLFVFGGTGRGDQGAVNDCALRHRHAFFTEMGFDGFKKLLAEPMLFKQVARGQEVGLILNAIPDQIYAG